MFEKFPTKRQYRVWAYEISHGLLLLRSNKSERITKRIDVLFANVVVMELPDTFDDLNITEYNIEDMPNIFEKTINLNIKDKKLYLLKGTNFTGYIVADSVNWHEDEGEYYEPSFLYPYVNIDKEEAVKQKWV